MIHKRSIFAFCLATLFSGLVSAQPDAVSLAPAFEALKSYQLGGDSSALDKIREAVNTCKDAPELRQDLEQRLIHVMRSDATQEAKTFACRQIALIGTEASVPVLSPLLISPEFSDWARYGLERIASPKVDEALLVALEKTDGKIRIGIINSLGARRCLASVDLLCKDLGAQDEDVAQAAARALGKMGGEEAVKGLHAHIQDPREPVKRAAIEAAIGVSEGASTSLRAQRLTELLQATSGEDPWSRQMKRAVFSALVKVSGEPDISMIRGALLGSDEDLFSAAVQLCPDVSDDKVTESLIESLKAREAPEDKRILVRALGDRKAGSARKPVQALVKSQDLDLRMTAEQALGSLGNERSVKPLLLAATEPMVRGPEKQVCQRALDCLPGHKVDDRLVRALKNKNESVRIEAIDRLNGRSSRSKVPDLLRVAQKDASPSVRKQAFNALADLAEPEILPEVLTLLVRIQEEEERTEAEQTASVLAKKLSDPALRCSLVLERLSQEETPSGKAALLRVLGRIADPAGLSSLEAAASDAEAVVRDAAIRSLADWPEVSPMLSLLRAAGQVQEEVLKIVALRGYTRMLGQRIKASSVSVPEALDLFKQGMALSSRPEEQKLLLRCLEDLRHADALAVAQTYVQDPNLAEEAMSSVARIYRAIQSPKEVEASLASDTAGNAVDGKPGTRWATGMPQAPGQWFLVDLGADTEVKSLTLDAADSPGDTPDKYDVYVFSDKDDPGSPVASGEGRSGVLNISCVPKSGRFVKIVQTGKKDGLYWSIHEIQVNGASCAGVPEERLKPTGAWKASSSDSPDLCALAMDGDLSTRWGTQGAQKAGQWFVVDLGESRTITRILLNAGDKNQDSPRRYSVFLSENPEEWGLSVAAGQGEGAVTDIPVYPKKARYIKVVQTGSADNYWWSIYELEVYAEP